MAGVKVPFNLKLLVPCSVVLVILGGAGISFHRGLELVRFGFYMVLTTVTSIGYGEIHPLSRMWTSVQ